MFVVCACEREREMKEVGGMAFDSCKNCVVECETPKSDGREKQLLLYLFAPRARLILPIITFSSIFMHVGEKYRIYEGCMK